MNNFKKAFADKKFRYGAFSTITTLFVFAILVVVNLVAGLFDFKYDLTTEKTYSLTKETDNIINALTEDVTVYALFQTGSNIPNFTELLDEYKTKSTHVNVVYRDPALHPSFISAYQKDGESIATNSLIVESTKRFKVIPASELVTYETKETNEYPYYQSVATAVNIESKVTNAIQYVLKDETPAIYALTGHNELELPQSYITAFSDAGFDYKTLDISLEIVPDDCQMMIITTPLRDISADEAAKLLSYLENNGKAMFFVDYEANAFPNLMGVLELYGIQLGDYIVFEGDSNYAYPQNNQIFIPQTVSHDITKSIVDNRYYVAVAQATGIETMSVKKNTLKIEPLLQTTKQAYGKNSINAQSLNKEEDDLDGPFDIAVAITDTYYVGDTNFKTQIIVMGNTSILNESLDQQLVGGTNTSLIVSCANWMTEKESTIYIPPKRLSSVTVTPLALTASGFQTSFILCVIVLPVAIIGTGLFVWLRRRNR